VKELRLIQREHNIRSSSKHKKEDIIKLILLRLSPTLEEKTQQEKVLEMIEKTAHPSPAPLTSLYKSIFNGVDIHDKYWYKHRNTYRTTNWRTKIVLCIFDCGVVNSFVLYSENTRTTLTSFRKIVATSLLGGF
jgi:hypothetical protein